MTTPTKLESWHSDDYVAAWIGQDVLANMLQVPRQISAALVAEAEKPVSHVIDIGAGHGPYLQVMLDAFPAARGTWVDSSEAMLEEAKPRLEPLGERVTYVVGDCEQLAGLDLQPADVIVTSRMVHHFAPDSIQRMYATALELLTPSGWFFNLDHFGSPEGWEKRYRAIRRQFTGKPPQEIAPHRHDYPLPQLDESIGYLRAAGFDADVPWRTFFTALLAGRKPE